MPSREPRTATERPRRDLAEAPAATKVEWPDDVRFAPPPPESLSRVLVGLKKLR